MSHHHAHHPYHHQQGLQHGYGTQPHDFNTHGMSQWATRRAGDLADIRDPQQGTETVVHGAHEVQSDRAYAQTDLGATAVEQVIPEAYR